MPTIPSRDQWTRPMRRDTHWIRCHGPSLRGAPASFLSFKLTCDDIVSNTLPVLQYIYIYIYIYSKSWRMFLHLTTYIVYIIYKYVCVCVCFFISFQVSLHVLFAWYILLLKCYVYMLNQVALVLQYQKCLIGCYWFTYNGL